MEVALWTPKWPNDDSKFVEFLSNAENYGWLMVLGKTDPCFDYHKFFKTYPEAFKQIYQLRTFMKYRIVEWDDKNP